MIPQAQLYIKNMDGKMIEVSSLTAKGIYKILSLSHKTSNTCMDRWIRVYPNEAIFCSDFHWRQWLLLPYQITHEVQLQNFAFGIACRMLTCRVNLSQLGITETDLCQKCGSRDGLLHFLFACPDVTSFWDTLVTWLGNWEDLVHFPVPDDFQEQEFLLRITDKTEDVSLTPENYIAFCKVLRLQEPGVW